MLSESEVQAITLRAPFVHQYADQPYFLTEINRVAEALNEQPHLNFFIRYRASSNSNSSSKAPTHKWSRIVKVVSIAESVKEAAPSSSSLTIQVPTKDNNNNDKKCIQWRSKVFWVALQVVGEDKPVHLPRISATRPTDAEIENFCIYQADNNPTETYKNATTSTGEDSAVLPSEAAAAEADAAPPAPRQFLPTAAQIKKLQLFSENCIVSHKWTPEEIDEVTAIKSQYSQTGAAAAPVAATLNRLHNFQVATRLMGMHTGPEGSSAEASASQQSLGRRGPSYASVPLASSRMGSANFLSPPQSPMGAPSSQSAFGESDSGATHPVPTPNASTHSPFLPKKLRERNMQNSITAMPASSQYTPTTTTLSPIQSTLLLGATQGYDADEFGSGQDLQEALIDEETFAKWKKTEEKELQFYAYANDEQRREYIDKVASITLRNQLVNKRNRLLGIESEKRLQRSGNLNESAGLWITDDKERARKAAEYKAALEGAGDKGGAGGRGGQQATANGGANADAKPNKTPEEALIDRFLEKRSKHEVCVDAIPDEWLQDDNSTATSNNNKGNDATRVLGEYSASPYMLAGKKNAGSAAAQHAVRSLLLHRSASRMAQVKRPRSEEK